MHTRLRSGAVLCVVLGLIMASCATTIGITPPTVISLNVTAVRSQDNPILTLQSSPSLGTNLNGPSLIRVPAWMERPLGRYYLYFAHHRGTFIRLAYADRLSGPWHVYEPGTLQLSEAPSCHAHVASPDVHVDEVRHEIRMYFHCPTSSPGFGPQRTFLAVSHDGLHFSAAAKSLGPPYFRVFQWVGYHYAIARTGVFLRSPDGAGRFESGPALLFSRDGRYVLRHAAVDLRGETLWVYYSRIGDRPERILVSRIHLTPDWTTWRASDPEDVLSPELEYEGVHLPLRASEVGEARGPLRELRDPAIFREGEDTYLLYSVAGESGIAMAELRVQEWR